MRLTKIFGAIFALAERLPTSATLAEEYRLGAATPCLMSGV